MKPIISRSPVFTRGNSIAGLNGVRSREVYGGSGDAGDLLGEYAGNQNYERINKYLGSPSHFTGRNHVLNNLVEEYGQPLKSSEVQSVTKSLVDEQLDWKLRSEYPELHKQLSNYAFSRGWQSEIDYLKQAALSLKNATLESLIDPNQEIVNLVNEEVASRQNWQPLYSSTDKVIASIPHIKDAFQQQPRYQPQYDQELVRINPLVRGLHFEDSNAYEAFKRSHYQGNVVEYPTFTSATTDKSISDGFSKRLGEHPVVMKFESPSGGVYNAFDANNPSESEYVFLPNSRFEILNHKIIPGNMEGLELTVRETNQPTQVQARTQSILDNLKAKKAQQLLNAHLASVPV